MTKINLNPNSSNFSNIKAMFEGSTTNKPTVLKKDLNSVTNTTQPEAKLPSATGPEGKKSPPAVPKKTPKTKEKYNELKQQHEANLLSKSVAPQVVELQATPEQKKPPVPPKPERLTKPPVPRKPTGLLKKSGLSKSPASSIKPGNSEEQAKIDENERDAKLKKILQNISARKIQEYFRKHVERVKKDTPNGYGIVSSEPYDGTKPEHKGRIYYFQINDQGILCAMYSPTKKPESPIAGTSKEVTGMDENFVELELKGNSFGREINNNDDLEDTFTVIPSIAVDSDTMIARFGGDNLVDYLQKKKFINPAHFENAVKDLDTLHKRSTYLTDIKVQNLTYDGKNVNFIDVDNRVKIDPAKPKIIQPDMTPFCTTTKLLRVLRPDVFDDTFYSFFLTPEAAAAKKPYLKVCDEYAFLLAMIKATSKKNHLKKAVYGVHVGVVDINREFHGVMNDKNKSYFRKWIQKHVKPEFHSNVESILRDPHEYAEKTSNPPYLSDMLLFKGSYNV